MSPEHVDPRSAPDRHYDLWALATVAYEAITGELPIEGLTTDELLGNARARRLVPVRRRNPELPAGLEAFFDRAFAERVDTRYPDAKELARAFARAAVSNGAPQRASSTPLRARFLRLRTAIALAAIGVGSAGVAMLSHPSGRGLAKAAAASTGSTSEPVAAAAASFTAGESPPSVPAAAPLASDEPVAAPVVAPRRPSASVAPVLSPQCAPPYTIDGKGRKRWRPECL
jgi:hypothetical protein